MQWLAKLCVERPVFAAVLILAICVVGFVGYQQLSLDRFPKVDFPTVTVTTVLPGSSPEEVETDISDPIEQAVNTIAGIEELRSVSSEGVSRVIVQFELEKDIDVAAQEVRDRVNDALADLPDGIEMPTISKVDGDATPIMMVAVEADRPIREITEIADRTVRRGIESASGVGQVRVLGGANRQVNVWVDPMLLRARGLTVADVERSLATQNLTIPGGPVETGPEQITLRVRGRVERVEDLERIVVRPGGDHPVRLADVARVEDGVEDADTVAIQDGKRTVVLTIRKQSGESTVEVVDAVRARVEELQARLPSGYALRIVRDDSQIIRNSVHSVEEHLVLGAIFAAIAVLVFLGNLRSTVIAAIAIPVSIIGTFAFLWWTGLALDTITLLALALAVGIVIDDAIVVLENIVKFVEEKKMHPREAAIAATKEIGLAVLATTLSLIAVFLPVAFMNGIVGRFLESFGLTMAFAIGISLVVSFTLTPMLSARWLRPIAADARAHKPSLLARLVDWFYKPIERVYMVILGWSMRRRWVIVIACALSLAAIVPLMKLVPAGFLPNSDEGQFDVNVRAPEGTSMEATAVISERLARAMRGLPEVASTTLTMGDGDDKSENRARIFVSLTAPEDREADQDAIMDRIRRNIASRAPQGTVVDVSRTALFQGMGTTALITYELRGPDLDQLAHYSQLITEGARRVPGAADVDSSLVMNKPELEVRIDRDRAAARGVSVRDIATTLRTLVNGEAVSDYVEDGERYDVRVRAEARYRASAEALAILGVPSATGEVVPLRDVVTIERGAGPASIYRFSRQRLVTISSNVAPGYAEGPVTEGFEQVAAGLDLPPGYTFEATGRSKEMFKTAEAFLIAFALSFVFMYLVLAAQFESWLHPLTILACLPLTLPFALVSLLISGNSLDIYSMLGILVLFGVVKKNSILQIDLTNQLRAAGMNRADAILQANKDRLRPILMTTVAFVAGMLPLAFSTGIGAGFNRATAGVVVGGQVLSLLLTLIATPVIYSLFDDVSAWLKRVFSKKSKAQEPVLVLRPSHVGTQRS
jgi:hydrophobe/amphiphile efflux-1 (HAE1) family protein